jgi:hypothetical protein
LWADVAGRHFFSSGYNVYCKGMYYTFDVEDHGARWSVRAE